MLAYLQRLEAQRVEVLHRSENSGPRLFLDPTFYASLPEIFVITDPDLDLNPALPDNFIENLLFLTEQYWIGNAGFALDISDPAALRPEQFAIGDKKFTICEWEEQFWARPPAPYPAEIRSTTPTSIPSSRFTTSGVLILVNISGPCAWRGDLPVRIPAIVGSDSADRRHPRKANILVIAILGMGGHDASNFGVAGVSP
jgi:hypothetical protein